MNDQEVGFGDIDQRIKQLLAVKIASEVKDAPAAPEEQTETDQVYNVFKRIAGADQEVDWQELKSVLDNVMKAELQQSNKSTIKKANVSGVNATPSGQNQAGAGDDNASNFVTALLALVCGAFCKDSPLRELIPAPSHQNPLLSSFVELGFSGFSSDACRSLVAMLDCDRSGRLGFLEFKELWKDLTMWKSAWSIYDKDRSGSLSGYELQEALSASGYRLNVKVMNVLMHRYGSNGHVKFEDFILCAIKLKTMMDIFKSKCRDNCTTATFTMDEWLENTLYS